MCSTLMARYQWKEEKYFIWMCSIKCYYLLFGSSTLGLKYGWNWMWWQTTFNHVFIHSNLIHHCLSSEAMMFIMPQHGVYVSHDSNIVLFEKSRCICCGIYILASCESNVVVLEKSCTKLPMLARVISNLGSSALVTLQMKLKPYSWDGIWVSWQMTKS